LSSSRDGEREELDPLGFLRPRERLSAVGQSFCRSPDGLRRERDSYRRLASGASGIAVEPSVIGSGPRGIASEPRVRASSPRASTSDRPPMASCAGGRADRRPVSASAPATTAVRTGSRALTLRRERGRSHSMILMRRSSIVLPRSLEEDEPSDVGIVGLAFRSGESRSPARSAAAPQRCAPRSTPAAAPA